LFTHFYRRLFRIAYVITRSRELSDEVVSDVFIRVWRRRERIMEVKNLKLYLYIATRNTAINYATRLAKNPVLDLEDMDSDAASMELDPEEALITREMQARLNKAIRDLPPRSKMIFTLVREDGLSYKEAARLLHLSVSTIDNQLVIAIRKLSASLYYSFRTEKK